MYCIKCGREVADGELFCASCSNQPGNAEQTQEIKQPERKQPETQQTRNIAQQKKPEPRKKGMNVLLIPLVLVCLLLAAACFCVYDFYNTMNVTKANYRVKEANLAARESELGNMQEDLDAALLATSTAEATVEAQKETIAELREQITALEGNASQGSYDATSAQQTIDRLTQEKTALEDQITELEQENETLTEEKAEADRQIHCRS